MAVESVLRPRSATVSVHDVAGSRKETQIKIAREEFQQFGGNATGLCGPRCRRYRAARRTVYTSPVGGQHGHAGAHASSRLRRGNVLRCNVVKRETGDCRQHRNTNDTKCDDDTSYSQKENGGKKLKNVDGSEIKVNAPWFPLTQYR